MQIVKKNLRMLLTMAFSLLNMGLVAVVAFILRIGVYLMVFGLSLLYLVMDLLLYQYICKKDIALAEGFE